MNETQPAQNNEPFEISQDQILKLKELEGECKITNYQLLRINYLKAIFFAVLMVVSVIGLLLLKYYKKLRTIMFYTSLEDEQIDKATHIYVKGTDKN